MVAWTGHGVDLVAAEPFIDVADEARLAVFAIVDHIDAELGLPVNDFTHGFPQAFGIAAEVEYLGAAGLQQIEKIGRPRQAAGVRRENSFGAVFHGLIQSIVTCAEVMTFFQRAISCRK